MKHVPSARACALLLILTHSIRQARKTNLNLTHDTFSRISSPLLPRKKSLSHNSQILELKEKDVLEKREIFFGEISPAIHFSGMTTTTKNVNLIEWIGGAKGEGNNVHLNT